MVLIVGSRVDFISSLQGGKSTKEQGLDKDDFLNVYGVNFGYPKFTVLAYFMKLDKLMRAFD